jgi:hypothetical protein
VPSKDHLAIGDPLKKLAPKSKGPKVLKPEEIIPFDDKEGFKDF